MPRGKPIDRNIAPPPEAEGKGRTTFTPVVLRTPHFAPRATGVQGVSRQTPQAQYANRVTAMIRRLLTRPASRTSGREPGR